MKHKARSMKHEVRSMILFFLFSVSCALPLFTQLPVYSSNLIAKSKKTIEDKTDKDKADKKEEAKVKKESINEIEFQPVLIGALLEKPQDYIGKKIKFRGKFSSFTTLALDYKPAMRSSKDFISICIFRPDSKIPLSELKLAYPVSEAKEEPIIRELEEGDLLEIYAQVFSAALDEPWADILLIKEIEKAPKKLDSKEANQQEKALDKNTLDQKDVKKKKSKKENEKESK